MPIKLITLNIEGRKHLKRVIPFLEEENADVICLQEVFERDYLEIKNKLNLNGSYSPMSNRTTPNKYYDQLFGKWGVCLLTKLKEFEIEEYYYRGKGDSPQFHNIWSDDRVLVYGTFKKNDKKYLIGTTHFCFTPDGQADNDQRKYFKKLISFLKKFNNFILAGDFNAPRGREIFTKFTKYFKDNLPKETTSTLDTKYHQMKNLRLVVDTIFTKGTYSVENIKLIKGLSDHKALVGKIN